MGEARGQYTARTAKNLTRMIERFIIVVFYAIDEIGLLQ